MIKLKVQVGRAAWWRFVGITPTRQARVRKAALSGLMENKLHLAIFKPLVLQSKGLK